MQTQDDDDMLSQVPYFQLEARFISKDPDDETVNELRHRWQQTVGGEGNAQRIADGLLSAVVAVTTEYLIGLIQKWVDSNKGASVHYIVLFKHEEYNPATAQSPHYLGIGVEKRRERAQSRIKKMNETVEFRRSRGGHGEPDPKVCEYCCWDEVTYSHERIVDYVWVQGAKTINNEIGFPVWICIGPLRAVAWGAEFETNRVRRSKLLGCHSI